MNIFPALIGNSSIKELCGGDIQKKKNSHAYIIEGPSGSGKHTAAREIAKAILCERSGDALPCGKCLSCRKADEGFNSCIQYINSEGKATITVDIIRRAIATVDFLPDDGDYSIYIIEDAEKMNAQAQNALLLTLEEPPPHVVFLLLTSDSHALLETVRSRALTLKTEIFTPARIMKEAIRLFGDNEKVKRAAENAKTLGDAVALIESNDPTVGEMRKNAATLASLLARGDSADTMLFLRDLKYDRQNAGEMLILSAAAIRDMISEKCGSDSLIFYTSQNEAKGASSSAQLPHLKRMYEECMEASDHIKNKNASSQTVFCSLAARCATK